MYQRQTGLLSMMLSLPEDWNYTTRGLAKICKEAMCIRDRSYTPQRMQETIIKLLEAWQKKRQRDQER